jgi:myo-inositol-1(or 4)-monophosphatase
VAVAGTGATRNGAPIAASTGARLEGAKVGGPKRRLERLAAVLPGIVVTPRIGSLALRMARVATGELDITLAGPNSHDWDLAAADLLVHEAGGALTTLAGQPVRYNQPEPVHGALVAAGRDRHATLIALARDRPQDFL